MLRILLGLAFSGTIVKGKELYHIILGLRRIAVSDIIKARFEPSEGEGRVNKQIVR